MKQDAGALAVLACLAVLAVIGAGCDNGSDVTDPSGGSAAQMTAGASPIAGAPPAAGTGAGGAMSGVTVADALPPNAVEATLPPSASGFVNSPPSVLGAWYAYGDGNDGANPGVCQTVGMHTTSQCSLITTPVPGMPFAPTGTSLAQMCTSGTVAQVINFGDPPALDYSNMFGAGIGLDLNNPGLDGGTGVKMPYNASAQKVIGISFDLDALPATGLRVEFPFGSASTAAGVWQPNATSYESPVSAGHNVLLFANVKQPSYVAAADMVPFDPSTLTSIQFHIPTTAKAAAPYHFCIDHLALIIQN